MSVERAERWRGPDLKIRVQPGDLVFPREPKRTGTGTQAEPFQVDQVVGRHDHLNRLPVGDADDDLDQASTRDVGQGGSFVGGIAV